MHHDDGHGVNRNRGEMERMADGYACCKHKLETGCPCPYVVEWLGDDLGDNSGIKRGTLVIVVPFTTDGSRSALVRLPARVVRGKDAACACSSMSAIRTVEPGVWSATAIAMHSRRRRRAPCIACEDAPGPPGRVFEWLIGEAWTAIRNKSMMMGLDGEDNGATDEDLFVACQWIQGRVRDHLEG